MPFVKHTLAGFFMLFISIGPALAGNPSCNCSPYPAEGTYGASDPSFSLTYLDGTEDTCPTKIRLRARRQDGQIPDVTLTCKGPGKAWTGIEMTKFGLFDYTVLPLRRPAGTGGELLDATIDHTEKVTMTLKVSMQMIHMSKQHRPKITLALQGKGKPPPCICAFVKKELEHAKEMRALYLNKSIIQAAESANLRGNNNNKNMWMDDQRKLHRFKGRASEKYKNLSYLDLVSGTNSDDISVGSGGIKVKENFKSATTEKAGKRSYGKKSERAFASTSPNSCKITLPTPSSVQKGCYPRIVIRAINHHEQQHIKKCKSLNSPSTFTTPDGTFVDWSKGGHTGIFHNRQILPSSGYYAWLQNVRNYSKNEAAAHQAEVRMLSKYLSTYCN